MMSGVFKFVTIAGSLILVALIVLTIISAFGGFEHSFSAPQV